MAETYTTTPAALVYRVSMITLNIASQSVQVQVREWDGALYGEHTLSFFYTGQPAMDLMVALNKANLSTTSLQRRVINQLVADGKLPAGAAGGTVD